MTQRTNQTRPNAGLRPLVNAVDRFLRAQWAMPIIVAILISLIVLNEKGFQRSNESIERLVGLTALRSELRLLVRDLLDAETGQRGYLLTGIQEYLAPYERGVRDAGGRITRLSQMEAYSPARRLGLDEIAMDATRKLTELALTITLKKQDKEFAWKALLVTDQSRTYMNSIRDHSEQIDKDISDDLQVAQAAIGTTLRGARSAIAALTVLTLIALALYWRQREGILTAEKKSKELVDAERASLEVQVRERTQRLSELATHLQTVREEERGRLARELHDELGAMLTAAKLDIVRLQQRLGIMAPEVTQRIAHLTQSINSGIALKRKIIEDLRPSTLSTLGLLSALRILFDESSRRAEIPIESNLETVDLPNEHQLAIYRVTQESLTNIFKYARAKVVRVSLRGYPQHVELAIQDDGIGFDVHAITLKSHGIQGMRHRIESLGGQLRVLSTIGNGTIITASLPVIDLSASVQDTGPTAKAGL